MTMTRETAASQARAVVRQGAHRLRAAGYEQARAEAEWLLSHLLGVRPLEMHVDDPAVPAATRERFLAQVEARAQGTPLQYLLGETEFLGHRLRVHPGVFIPRPETEAVVEAAIGALRVRQQALGRPLQLLDLGVGSGCIAVSLAHALPACVVVGVELSWVALRTARENVLRHGLDGRVRLVQGSWLDAVRGKFDGVVSNPPYVPAAEVDHLPLDVRQEPRLSLDGGVDGLREIGRLLDGFPRVGAPGCLLALECGVAQAAPLLRRVGEAEWCSAARPLRDLAGRPRGILAAVRH